MRYSTVPAGVDGAQGGAAPASVPWTPADRSAFRHLEASAEKKVSVGRRFQSHKTSWVTVKSSYCLTCLIETHDFEFRRELFFFHCWRSRQRVVHWAKTFQSAVFSRAEMLCWREIRERQASLKAPDRPQICRRSCRKTSRNAKTDKSI